MTSEPMASSGTASTPADEPPRVEPAAVHRVAVFAAIVGGAWALWLALRSTSLLLNVWSMANLVGVPNWYWGFVGVQLLVCVGVGVCLVRLAGFVLVWLREARSLRVVEDAHLEVLLGHHHRFWEFFVWVAIPIWSLAALTQLLTNLLSTSSW